MKNAKVGDVLYRYEDDFLYKWSFDFDSHRLFTATPRCEEWTVTRTTECFVFLQSPCRWIEIKRAKNRNHAWAYADKNAAIRDYLRRKNWQIDTLSKQLDRFKRASDAARALLEEVAP
jgi:hypothetical protein